MIIKNCSDTSVLQMQKGKANKRHGNSFSQLKNEKENVTGDKRVWVHSNCECSPRTQEWVAVREQVFGPLSGGLKKVAQNSGMTMWCGLAAMISFNASGGLSSPQLSGKSTQLQGLKIGSVCEHVERVCIRTQCLLPQERLKSLNVCVQLLKPFSSTPYCFLRKITFFLGGNLCALIYLWYLTLIKQIMSVI